MSDPMSDAVLSMLLFGLVIFFFTVGSVIITTEKHNKLATVFAIIASLVLWIAFASISGEYIRYIIENMEAIV